MHQKKENTTMDKKDVNNLKRYLLLSYVFFWILLALTGYMIFLDVPMLMQTILKNVCAWSPTFAILIMFKKLYPGFKFKAFMKLHFS